MKVIHSKIACIVVVYEYVFPFNTILGDYFRIIITYSVTPIVMHMTRIRLKDIFDFSYTNKLILVGT